MDLVLAGARVHATPGDPVPADALAIVDGAIAAVGSLDAARAAARRARVVDLRGATVLPAFIDSHTHFHRAAILRHLFLDFEALAPGSVAEVVDAVRARAGALPPGAWIQGDSITAARLAEGRLPTRQELDAAAPDQPVLIRGIGKHVIAANSAALAAAGITHETPDPPGGRIERDAHGEPTGVLHERAKLRLDTSVADTVVPPTPRDQRLAALRAGFTELHRMGIATIGEMIRLTEEADDLAALHQAGELAVRARLHYRIHETEIRLDWLRGLGVRRGLGDDWLRVLGTKISIDGWCIFRNAAVYEPYRGEPGNTGLLRIEPDELTRLVAASNTQGLGIAVHAVGARAVDAALDAFAAAGPPTAGPWRLEHAHLDVTDAQLRRAAGSGLVLSAQPAFLPAYRPDWEQGLSPERVQGIMRLATARRLGIPVIINSDQPSGPAGPLLAIAAAVDRCAGGGGTVGADEAIPLVDAWRAHTSVPAEVMGEPRLGHLVTGARADLVVIGADPFAPGVVIDRLPIEATLVDGQVKVDTVGRFA
jgi:predicted amidohydrolase YtcJ